MFHASLAVGFAFITILCTWMAYDTAKYPGGLVMPLIGAAFAILFGYMTGICAYAALGAGLRSLLAG